MTHDSVERISAVEHVPSSWPAEGADVVCVVGGAVEGAGVGGAGVGGAGVGGAGVGVGGADVGNARVCARRRGFGVAASPGCAAASVDHGP